MTQITPMNAGLSAYMVKVDFRSTSDPSWMIRVINPEYKMIFEREMGAILHASENFDIPLPKIVKMDSTGEIIPESYYIYEYIKGDTLGKQLESLSFDKKETIYADLGHILAKMHLDQRKEPGVLLYTHGKFEFDPFELKHSLEEDIYLGQEEDIQWAFGHAFTDLYPEYLEDCKRIWKNYKDSLRISGSPIGFSHNDLLADNLIIHNGKIAAIIDWEQGCYGDVQYDLARTERGIFRRIIFLSESEREKLREVFLSSYHNIRPIEPIYWEKRVAHHIVQVMDDLGQIPAYRERLPKEYCDRVEQNLLQEINEYIEEYLDNN
ncbi:MAG: phosphotransferase family protein [Promethearchaeota archaeon]